MDCLLWPMDLCDDVSYYLLWDRIGYYTISSRRLITLCTWGLAGLSDGLNVWVLLSSLTIAGILGDTVNYHIGKYLGPKVFESNSRFFKREYLDQTNAFYAKWGGFTIVAARFAPIVRTFAPFVAGIGSMNYKKFITYNIGGAVAWVFTFILAGYFFGNLPVVKRNFHVVIFGVIFVSILPMLIPWVKSKLDKPRKI